MTSPPKSPLQSYPFDDNLPDGFNLPSPLPLSPDSDTSSVQDLSPPRISFSFPSSHSQQQHQQQQQQQQSLSLISESSQTLYRSPLLSPPAESSVTVHHIAPIEPTPPAASVTSFSLSSVTNRLPSAGKNQPAFYTSSFRLSDIQQQHPSYTSWPQHSILPFNPFYSPPPSCGPFQFGFTSTGQHPFISHLPRAQNSSNVGVQYKEQVPLVYRDVSQQIPAMHHLQQQQQQCGNNPLQYCDRQPGMLMMQALLKSPYHQQQDVHARAVGLPQSQPLQPGHLAVGHSNLASQNSYPVVGPNLPHAPCGNLLSPIARYPPFGARLPSLSQCYSPCGLQGPTLASYSATVPRRTLAPEKRVFPRVLGPQQPTQTREPPSCSSPQNYPSPQSGPAQSSIAHQMSRSKDDEDEEDAVIFVSASRPASQLSVSAGCTCDGPKTLPNTKIVRPIPIRVIPPPSVFAWSRPEVSAHTPVQTTIATPSQVSPVSDQTCSPSRMLQVHRQLELATVAHASISGEIHDSVILSEGDIDVGEQVTIETDEPESCHVVRDDKLEEYKDFVSLFRTYRITHNYTLVDVIQQVSSQYRQKLTLRSMTDFEDLVLEKRKYTHIITILKVWMEDVAKRDISGVKTFQLHGIFPSCYQRRKARTSSKVLHGLESFFSRKRNPSAADYRRMAREWKVEERFVRNWFSERRKKEHHGHHPAEICELDLDWDAVSFLQKGSVIPSSSHSITVEVSTLSSGDILHASASPFQVFI